MSSPDGWQPATEAEVALYDALATDDQEGYFRVLTGIELMLPVSTEAMAGRSPLGWGTWTADDRTHLLSFTSAEAMQTCLAQHAGGARSLRLAELAEVWPNQEWWLAVNPGLPIEGYLPMWFVVQLSRGDARLPRQTAPHEPRDRLERVRALERAKANRAARVPSAAVAPALPAGAPLALPAAPEPAAPAPVVPAPAPPPVLPGFVPANSVEEQLLAAAEADDSDAFVSTLLLATVLLPVPAGQLNGHRPGSPDFPWWPLQIDGVPHVVCYTSVDRMEQPGHTVPVKFVKLINAWPDPKWSFAVNPGTPVGAILPSSDLLALAAWAAEVGLSSEDPGGDDTSNGDQVPEISMPPAVPVDHEVTVMQKALAPSQVGYYLERGYDRVSGFVHRASELGRMRTPEQLRQALGLTWTGAPFQPDAAEIYLLRWSAYRPSLYRIPYGGPDEDAMRAMEGWVVERPPFRGNGFAPAESDQIIAEFKVDSCRLPNGTRLLRLTADGTETIVAVLDTDLQRWLRTDGG